MSVEDDNDKKMNEALGKFVFPLMSRDPKFIKDFDPEFLKAIESEDFDSNFWEEKFLHELEMRKRLKIIEGKRSKI